MTHRTVTVGKMFTFHAAHHDIEADDKCARVHGHTYKLEIECTGELVNGHMLIHGNVLKDLYREQIEPFVEHKDLNDTCPYNPTMENVLMWLTDMVEAYVRHKARQVQCVKVRLWETPTMYAETRRKTF